MDIALLLIIVAEAGFIIYFLYYLEKKITKKLDGFAKNMTAMMLKSPYNLEQLTKRIEAASMKVKEDIKKSKEENGRDGRI